MAKAKYGSGKRFASFTQRLQHHGYSAASARAIAASAGRRAHGVKSMARVAAAGRRRAGRKK